MLSPVKILFWRTCVDCTDKKLKRTFSLRKLVRTTTNEHLAVRNYTVNHKNVTFYFSL